MMKEIKLIIDGKEIAVLTAEQIKALGIEIDDGCVCDRVERDEEFYYIGMGCNVECLNDSHAALSNILFKTGNYYRDESYAKQIALHQRLNNLLRRYSEQHGGDGEWDGHSVHHEIVYSTHSRDAVSVGVMSQKDINSVYFRDGAVAQQAIEEVVKPFIKEHPDFVW